MAFFAAVTDDGADGTHCFAGGGVTFNATHVALTFRPVEPAIAIVAIVGISLVFAGTPARALARWRRSTALRPGFRGRIDLILRPEEADLAAPVRLKIEADSVPMQIAGVRIPAAAVARAAPDWRAGATA